MDYKLKPCPFCGSEVTLTKDPLWEGSHGYIGDYEFNIECGQCGCNICLNQNTTIYRTEDEAIKNAISQWNKRSDCIKNREDYNHIRHHKERNVIERTIDMTSLEKVKDAYETMKNHYSYFCKNVSVTRDEEECYTELTFEHQTLQYKTSFCYSFSNDLYPENDQVVFNGNSNMSYDCYRAIYNLIDAIHSHRMNEVMMEIIVNYFKEEVKK